MAALPEPVIDTLSVLRPVEAAVRPAATILPMRKVDMNNLRLIDEASGGRLGAARGLITGLGLGAVLWVAIGLLAWEFFR